jgi:tetratricopeptide (TPR) repeat protein
MNTLLAIAITISATGFTTNRVISGRTDSGKTQLTLSSAATAAPSGEFDQSLPPAPWAKDDPADSLYTLARAALERGDYRRAAEVFHRINERYPSSKYASQARYYEAFSLYRSGETRDLRNALAVLRGHPIPSGNAGGDSQLLLTRVCGELAKRGDESCAASITQLANTTDSAPTNTVTSGSNCPSVDDDNDDRISALNALLQMDSERAVPILQKVLERRDPCSAVLRRKAVFLISQKPSDATADILMRVAQTDPDQETREQAVFWLSQVPGGRSTDLLETILKGNGDQAIKEKALFAVSQQSGTRPQQILRDYALRESEPSDLREKAIFWLGQRRSTENMEFLRTLYGRLNNQDLKEKVLFSLAQQPGMGNDRFLMDIAVNPKEDIELRKKAIFWAGQSGEAIPGLIALYDRMPDSEMKEQLIFVYSQRQSDSAAMDKLFSIARSEKDPELRKKAIFWLGQSHDPRVQKFLLDLINR